MAPESQPSESAGRAVDVRWLGGYRTEIDIRGGAHRILGDEAPEYGGDDAGPMPTELLLAGVGSCMCLAVSHFAKKRRIELGRLSVRVSGVKDAEVFRFREISVEVAADLADDRLQKLVERAKAYCYVSNTLIEGCAVHVSSVGAREGDS